jgi:hypothetical protein
MNNSSNLEPFDTLQKSKNIPYSNRWHPKTVPVLESAVSRGLLSNMPRGMRKNIAYSLMYLQHMELQLKELNLHNVIITMLYKNFIITGTSIIEALFYHLLKSNGLWRQKEWELENIIKSNEFSKDLIKYKVETHMLKKIVPIDDEMNFDSMIKKMESKKLINLSHKAYPYIKKLKSLRNKVHLQINENSTDTDWFNFNYIDYLWMKYTLYRLLTDASFNNCEGSGIEFLKVNSDELESLKKDVNKDKDEQ